MISKLKLRVLNIVKNKGGRISLAPQAYLIWNKIKLSGKENRLIVRGNGKFRRCTISVKGEKNLIEIEDGANISFSQLEIVGNNCLIRIGKGTDIGGAYLSAKGEETLLTIGEHCMFSRNINVMTYDGHSIFDKNTKHILNSPKKITIGDRVWIAANATILKGVTIYDGAIVALGSIVTKDVLPHTIVAGCPARQIKENIEWKH